MSKIYKCIDCGKEFRFDFLDINIDIENCDIEQFQNEVNDYVIGLNFPLEANICYECLDSIKTIKKDKKTDKNNTSDNSYNEENIETLQNSFKEEENILKDLTEEKEIKELNELNQLKKRVEQNQTDLNNLLKELENVEQKETDFCNEFRDLENKLYFEGKEQCRLNDLKLDYENKNNIFCNNTFSELFHISFNEKFGSINGCKFGDPYVSSNYDSINGGWGYIILLTKLLAVKYMFESPNYDLTPEGNFSKVKNKKINEEYEIGISDINRTKDKFNRGMEAYLQYLNEFVTFLITNKKIKITNPDLFPKIDGNKINDKCIQIQNGKESLESWYQCMKFLLTILKFLICSVLKDENKFYEESDGINKVIKNNISLKDISSDK